MVWNQKPLPRSIPLKNDGEPSFDVKYLVVEPGMGFKDAQGNQWYVQDKYDDELWIARNSAGQVLVVTAELVLGAVAAEFKADLERLYYSITKEVLAIHEVGLDSIHAGSVQGTLMAWLPSDSALALLKQVRGY